MKRSKVFLDVREIATVLHALRVLQQRDLKRPRECDREECDHFCGPTKLSPEEIDKLCLKINCA